MDEKAEKIPQAAGVAEPGLDGDIDKLLRARGEIDTALKRHRAQVAVLFTDIVGSTAFFERFGDTAGLLMLRRHDDLVMPAISEGGGTVIKTIGDAVLATFPHARAAADAGIQIQQRLHDYNKDRSADEQIHVRVGINYGTGFLKEGDIFGDVVNVAARFVKSCAPAQILVSGTVYETIKSEPGIKCRKLGSSEFHGKSAPEETYEILWTTQESYRQIRKELDQSETPAASRNQLGRYELLEELGRGAMGVVYRAYDPAVGRIVALKTVRVDVSGPDREELIKRLRQEAQAAGRLEHPNIVTVYDAGEADGLFYITMQFVKGQTLATLLADRKLLPVKDIVPIIDRLLDALHYAHERGIVHRDLKPSNILNTPEGTQKIVDFGVAKIVEAGTTHAGIVVGTPSYMSPEQAQGGRVDRRSDIFSLGAIFYELLTGEKAFPGNTPTTIIYKILHEEPIPPRVVEPTIEPGLEQVVRKALVKDPFGRYQTCEEFREALKTSISHTPVRGMAAPALPPTERAAPALRVPQPPPLVGAPPRSHSGLVVAGVAVALFGLVAWQQGWVAGGQLAPPEMGVTQPAMPTSQPAVQNPPPPAANTTQLPVSGNTEQQAAVQSGTGGASQPSGPPVANEPAPATASPTGSASAAAPAEKKTASQPRRSPVVKKTPTQQAPPPPALTPEQQKQIASWFRQAEIYRSRGQYNEAIIALREVLRIDPGNQRAREELQKVRQQVPRSGSGT